MARNFGSLTTSAALSTGTAAKTILQLIAPANQGLAINAFGIGFTGVTVTDPPIRVRILRQTTAGTVTSRAPLKTSVGGPAIQSTGSENATAEPTAGDVLWDMKIHPQAAVEVNVQGRGWEVDGGGRIGLEVTATVAVNANAHIDFEE